MSNPNNGVQTFTSPGSFVKREQLSTSYQAPDSGSIRSRTYYHELLECLKAFQKDPPIFQRNHTLGRVIGQVRNGWYEFVDDGDILRIFPTFHCQCKRPIDRDLVERRCGSDHRDCGEGLRLQGRLIDTFAGSVVLMKRSDSLRNELGLGIIA